MIGRHKIDSATIKDISKLTCCSIYIYNSHTTVASSHTLVSIIMEFTHSWNSSSTSFKGSFILKQVNSPQKNRDSVIIVEIRKRGRGWGSSHIGIKIPCK